MLCAAGLCIATGSDEARVIAALPGLTTVRGRMELAAQRRNGAAVFVDYAHKPGAVIAALQSLRPHVMGRIIAIVGAGGDRDRGKRPLMGEAARQHADVVYVTDDNPRSEDPAAIRREVMAGAPAAREAGDRRAAIRAAAAELRDGDVLVIAGKGHEQGQTVAGVVHPFDDVLEVRAALEAAGG